MNIGFVLNNIGNSEFNYELIKKINNLKDITNQISPCIFYQNIMPPVVTPCCFLMNLSGLSNYYGKLVVSEIEAASIVNSNNPTTENWYYFWDIEWLDNVINYESYLNLLTNFKLVVRSESYKTILRNFTGRDDILVANTMEELFKCLI
jgi:hypothetical protein